MSKTLSITAIAEIVLSVRDIPTMRDFYQKVFGFEFIKEESHLKDVGYDPEGVPTISFLKILPLDSPLGRNSHPQVLVLIDHQLHGSGRVGHDITRSTLHHLAFEISPESYHEQKAILEDLNLEPKTVEFANISAKALFFKDPEGNSLELICHDGKSI